GVKYQDNDPSKGALITIENLDKMPLPALVSITEADGRVIHLKLPAEIWQRGSTWTFKVHSTRTLKSVVLDPKKQLPDENRANNTWKSS
ncbi:MAG TPA: M1 family peptidase, partial [Chitinophagaceae bacterium]|nr:M1 family peptidase [Chitinophagaceae bacterium]